MSNKTELLENMDLAAEDFQFPGWECGEQNAFVGAMRASGFSSSSGCGLVFEDVEYSLKEGVIQCMTYCIATFPVTTWLTAGEAVQVNLRLSETGELPVSWGEIQVTSRERKFTVQLEKTELISSGYLEADADTLTPEAILLKICHTLPREWLFCEAEYLKSAFGMPEDADRLFIVEEWQHPSFDRLYGDEEIKPSEMPDIVAMAEAVCSKDSSPKLAKSPNTSWDKQCAKTK